MISMWTKIKVFTKHALRDIECGHHSGFRPCCIFCYAILDNLSSMHRRQFADGRRLIQRVIARYRCVRYGFIPCPVCLFRKPVKVKRCIPGPTNHRWNFLTADDCFLLRSPKINGDIGSKLIKLDKFLDEIFLERDPLLRYY